MEREFIPYNEALALKELGFDDNCLAYYNYEERLKPIDTDLINFRGLSDGLVKAPLYQQAFRWFREKYRLDGKPEYFLNDWYCFIINDMKQEDTSRKLFTEFPSYEEAELECLKKLIEIVKEKS